MANDLTTQQVSEGAVTGRTMSMGGAEKIRALAGRDNAAKQAAEYNDRLAEIEAAKKQLRDDPEKAKEIVADTVDFFNKFVKEVQVDLRYEVDDKTDEIVIKLFERGTDKLIRQIPPEAILNLKQRISDLLGIIYDKMA
jgi:flagellar protein FlaG